MELRHHASAFITRRVQLVKLLLLRGKGLTPFDLRGSLRQLPCYPRRWVDNDDLLASIDRHGQNLADCLSLVESALAMVRCRSPLEANSVEDRLAKAEARIVGEISVITFASSQSHL